jgi:hypothetical protein
MSLSTANIIQENSFQDSATATTRVVSLPGGTTAGNSVLLFITSGGGNPKVTAPDARWVLDLSNTALTQQVFRLPNVGAGETSWTFTPTAAAMTAWYCAEVSGLDDDPLDTSLATQFTVANGGTGTAANTSPTGGLSTLAFAAISNTDTGTGHTYTWSGWTNGFTERVDTGGPTAPGMAVAVNASTSTITWSTTATLASTDVSSSPAWLMVAYREKGTPIVNPLYHLAGFEWGHHGGGGTLLGVNNMWANNSVPTGTWGTAYLIQAASARTSGYGLRMVQAGAAARVPHGTLPSGVTTVVVGLNVRVVSGSGVVIVCELTGTSASGPSVTAMQLVYDVTATKFGVRCGTTGTIQYQSGTTALNTWVWVDVRAKIGSTTWTADWQLETGTNTYTMQTSASLTAQDNGWISTFRTGGNAAQTVTMDFDDLVLSQFGPLFPLGPHNVKVLKVDPAGTPTISGTTANFNTFASNGTLTAWNATTARNAIDELPATISASADGVVQVTVAASDYAEFPMETYTLGPQETIAGVRMVCPMWCTSAGGAVTAGFRGWDGTAETVLIAIGSTFNPAQPTAYATGAPLWRTAMWQVTNGWTQTMLNAAALRFGFATDVAPGLQALYLEIAVGKTRTRSALGDVVDVDEDYSRQGIVSVTTIAPASAADTSLYYEVATVPTTVVVPQGTTVTTQLNAAFPGDVNYLAVSPPPEPPPLEEP